MADLRATSLALTEQFIAEVEVQCPQLELVTPRDATIRGSQVSFRFEHGYAAMQALIERGVIGDFRAPDIMRFGFTPLYIDAGDVTKAVRLLSEVINGEHWREERYQARSRVT